MPYFLRALRLTLRYRATLVGSIACSFLVAVLWSGNIGALYPVFEVVLKNRSLQAWIAEEIDSSRARIADHEQRLADLRRGRGGFADRRTEHAREADLDSERRFLERSIALRPWIDHYLPRDPFRTVVLIVGVLMSATLVRNLFLVGNLLLSARLNQLVVVDLQRRFYGHALRMEPSLFGQRGTSGMMAHMGADIGGVGNGLNQLFGGAIREPLKIAACIAGAAIVSWRLLAVSLLLAPLAFVLLRSLAMSIRRATHRAMQDGLLMSQVVHETFQGLSVVQSFTMEEFERARFSGKAHDCMRRAMRIVYYNALSKPVTEVLGLTIVCIALIAGAYLVLTQNTHILGVKMCERPMGLPALLVFYGLLVGISDPARRLSDIFGAIQSGVASAERLYPILDTEPTVHDPPQPVSVARPHASLAFENVEFHYTPEQPVLRGIDLRIAFGESVAIVGPNGCGKTTLVHMVPRFHDPTRGLVRLDGVSLRDMALKDLRGRIGIVSQQFTLFNDTVFNNIRYGSPAATRDDVMAAAEKAHCHRLIERQLERGYETIVGESGNRLSGGQRQRIALARAFLRDPEILILDEATSQVDLESEQLIHKALEEFARRRTVIMITHRLSTLALANRIVVMDAGRIVDCGSHDELTARCDVYRRLHEMQFRRTA